VIVLCGVKICEEAVVRNKAIYLALGAA